MTRRFVDMHVRLRYLTGEHPANAKAALALLERTALGLERGVTAGFIVAETGLTLQSCCKQPRWLSHALLLPIIELDGIEMEDKQIDGEALDPFANTNLSFADAGVTAFMWAHQIPELNSWDRGVDRVQAVHRVEPV